MVPSLNSAGQRPEGSRLPFASHGEVGSCQTLTTGIVRCDAPARALQRRLLPRGCDRRRPDPRGAFGRGRGRTDAAVPGRVRRGIRAARRGELPGGRCPRARDSHVSVAPPLRDPLLATDRGGAGAVRSGDRGGGGTGCARRRLAWILAAGG